MKDRRKTGNKGMSNYLKGVLLNRKKKYAFTLIPKSHFMAQVLVCMFLSFIRHLRGIPSHQSQHYLNNTNNNFDFFFFCIKSNL